MANDFSIVVPPWSITVGTDGGGERERLKVDGARCASCSTWVSYDHRPIGWAPGPHEPVCDKCLLQRAPDLGALLGLLYTAVEIGESPHLFENPETARQLGVVFAGFAKRFGPIGDRAVGIAEMLQATELSRYLAILKLLINPEPN